MRLQWLATRELLRRLRCFVFSPKPAERSQSRFWLMLFLLGAGSCYGTWASSLFGSGVVVAIIVRMLLFVLGLGAVWGAGIASLQMMYQLSAKDARTRTLAAFGAAQYPTMTVNDSVLTPKNLTHPIHLVGGPGTVHLASHLAAVLERAGQFRRVVGPGDQTLLPGERIFALVDLRPQTERSEIMTPTRDGIPVRVDAELDFQILPGAVMPVPISTWRLLARVLLEVIVAFYALMGMSAHAYALETSIPQRVPNPPPTNSPTPLYTFRERQVVRAAYLQRVAWRQDRTTQVTTWRAMVLGAARGRVAERLGSLTLDRATEPEDAVADHVLEREATPRWEIQREALRAARQNSVTRLGVTVFRLRLGSIALAPGVPEDLRARIENQRTATWRAEWQRRMRQIASDAEAETQRLRQNARAEAQTQMFRTLLKDIPPNADAPTLRRIIALRIVQLLEQTQQASDLSLSIPEQTFTALALLRQFLKD